jgi:FkbM family methyltransferase
MKNDALVRSFASRLNRSSSEDAAAVLAELIHGLRDEAVGKLMDELPPDRRMDYEAQPIMLRVSSSEVRLRLISVEKEPFTVDWIERFVRRGDVFYDIGANVGAYSLIAAKATGGDARVYAFEPSPSSFNELSRNVLLNECADSVVALPFALWSENETLSLTLNSAVPGAALHRLRHLTGTAGANTIKILGVRLDDLVERFGLPAPNHVKIDTDGHELEVLRGAERTLARQEWRSIIVELDRAESARNQEIRKLLARSGFDGGILHRRQASPNFPRPEGRPDVYWTFVRAASRPIRTRRVRPRTESRARASALRTAQRRAIGATLTVVACLFLLFVFLPEQLGDRPYDVFSLQF